METLQNAKETKARKEHQCCFCYDKIIIGEVYMKSVHVDSGELWNWNTHKYCDKIANTLDMYNRMDMHEGLSSDDFQEFVSDKYENIMTENMPISHIGEYSELIHQLSYVKFSHQLWTVIRYLNKEEITAIKTALESKNKQQKQ